MHNPEYTTVTEEQLIEANPWFFWEPMVKAMGYHIPKIKLKNGKLYYFVRYENHTTVYDIDPTSLILSYRAHISDDEKVDLDKLL